MCVCVCVRPPNAAVMIFYCFNSLPMWSHTNWKSTMEKFFQFPPNWRPKLLSLFYCSFTAHHIFIQKNKVNEGTPLSHHLPVILYGLALACNWLMQKCTMTMLKIKHSENSKNCSCIFSILHKITAVSLSIPLLCLSFYISQQQQPQSAGVSWMPARRVTSPPLVILWSTRLIRTVTGSSRHQSPHSASSSTSTLTLR